MPFDLSDLIQPAGDALLQAKSLVAKLQPVMVRLDSLTQRWTRLCLPDGSRRQVPAGRRQRDGEFQHPESRKRLNDMLDSLRVSTENLKVVSTNAKALTATLAEKPWRVFWGRFDGQAAPEDEVLKSNQVIRLKPDVDVNATTPAKSHYSFISPTGTQPQPRATPW